MSEEVGASRDRGAEAADLDDATRRLVETFGGLIELDDDRRTCAEEAVHLASLRIPVVPLDPSSKRPLIRWKRYQSTPASETEAAYWFRRWPDASLGVVCGKVSGGLEVIDFDSQDEFPRWWRLVEAAGGGDLFAHLSITSTPRGWHVAYLVDDPSRSKPLARAKEHGQVRSLIDLKGEGGYVRVPPTRGFHAFQGNVARAMHVSAEAREILVSSAKALNQHVRRIVMGVAA